MGMLFNSDEVCISDIIDINEIIKYDSPKNMNCLW